MSFGEVKLISINSRMGHTYDIEEKMRRTLHFTPHMIQDKGFNHISNSNPGIVYQKFKQVKYFKKSYGLSKFSIAFQSLGEVKWTRE